MRLEQTLRKTALTSLFLVWVKPLSSESISLLVSSLALPIVAAMLGFIFGWMLRGKEENKNRV